MTKALSPTDSFFLLFETRSQPMHVAGLNLFTPPADARPDYVARLMAAWRTHTEALAPFNKRPVMRLGRWYWEEDTEFELDYHLRHLALPQPGRIRELLALVSQLHGSLIDRNRPLWEAYVIEGLPGGRFATYVKLHHALVDGVTGARIMAHCLSRDPAAQKPAFWASGMRQGPGPILGSGVDRLLKPLLEAARAGSEILPGIGSGLWDLVRASQSDNHSALPFQAPATPLNVEISGSRRFAAQSYSLQRLKQIGQAAGATVNDVTLAMCAGALRRHLQSHNALPATPLIAMVPVSLHGEAKDGDESGNQVGLLLANLATHLDDPLERLQRIVQSTTAAKARLSRMSRLQKMAHGVAMLAPAGPSFLTGAARKRPMFNLVISNVPGPHTDLHLNGARLDEVYPVSIPTHYLALNITISGYADKLGFGFIACRRSVPALQRMLDYTDESIAELEQALAAAPARKVPRKRATAGSTKKPVLSEKNAAKTPLKSPDKTQVKTRSGPRRKAGVVTA